nr:reverse transcriptase domain-containing protein [Tanacetum cinerariifolium]
MRTRSQSRNNFPQQEASPVIVEPLRIELPFLEDQFQEDPPEDPPEITRFQQRFDESFYEAWDHFNDLLRACPHHGFFKLHQLDTFYNALNVNDQDSLNSAVGVVAKVSTSSSTLAISSDVAELKDMVRALLLDKKNQSSAPAPSPTHALVKAVEPNCVTCDGAHSRCFLKTGQALIDVYKGELTLRIRNEAITYNLDQTSRYSANYNQMTANKIDVIDMACEDYSQEVFGFSNVTASDNPTPYDDPIVSTTSPTLTLFGDSDFLLFEEADAFLGLEDDLNLPEFNPFYYDPEGDILLLEAILNSEPLPPLPNHEQYMPSFKKELKVYEAKTVKSSVDDLLRLTLSTYLPTSNTHFWRATTSCSSLFPKSWEMRKNPL